MSGLKAPFDLRSVISGPNWKKITADLENGVPLHHIKSGAYSRRAMSFALAACMAGLNDAGKSALLRKQVKGFSLYVDSDNMPVPEEVVIGLKDHFKEVTLSNSTLSEKSTPSAEEFVGIAIDSGAHIVVMPRSIESSKAGKKGGKTIAQIVKSKIAEDSTVIDRLPLFVQVPQLKEDSGERPPLKKILDDAQMCPPEGIRCSDLIRKLDEMIYSSDSSEIVDVFGYQVDVNATRAERKRTGKSTSVCVHVPQEASLTFLSYLEPHLERLSLCAQTGAVFGVKISEQGSMQEYRLDDLIAPGTKDERFSNARKLCDQFTKSGRSSGDVMGILLAGVWAVERKEIIFTP